MTVVVGFYCGDGVVIAADSMITPSVGNLAVGHHKGQKIFARNGNQIFAFAGEQGLAMRALYIVEQNPPNAAATPHPLLYVTTIFAATQNLFGQTGFNIMQANLSTLLAFEFNNSHQCCVFGMGGSFQPMLFDANNYYIALGSGKQFADPFLRFVVDTFCPHGNPSVGDARFLATWVVQHVIDTNPGGVAGPIRMAVLARNQQGIFEATEIPSDDIQEHLEAVKEAGQVLRDWRSGRNVVPADPAAHVPTLNNDVGAA